MGKHREWRKIAKRERRRKLRIKDANARDNLLHDSSEEHVKWLNEQQALDEFEYEQIKKSNLEENNKWIKAEAVALEQWNLLQERKQQLHQEYLQQQAKLKLEWELEKQRRQEEENKLKEIEEEKKKKHEIFLSQLEDFLSGNSNDPPPELLISHESRPQTELCPFFTKTACCRFGDQCSRNHRYPGISKVLLAANFFVHFGLNNANFNEYDTDVMLEYEDNDTYKEFLDFFDDVLPEFETFGKITQFKVCNNYEKHLRGNTYIEFEELRCAVAAYRSMHSRWYGGRQLSLQFCLIDSWKNAICGLAPKRRCPKGRACNFLHVFRNPYRLSADYKRNTNSGHPTPSRTWRWSESPERDMAKRSRRSRSHERERHDERRTLKCHKEKRSRKRSSNRSKSPAKHKYKN